MRFRNLLYDYHILPVSKIPMPVISVGNLSAGGSGKSPFTIWLAKQLTDRDVKVAILSRGYGRKTKNRVLVSKGDGPLVNAATGGDEPLMMSLALKGVPIVVDRDRVSGAKYISENFQVDCIILDDALQHRRLHRDVDIVLWNSRQSGVDLLPLPAGHQRDNVKRLRKIDFLILTKVDEINNREKWAKLESYHPIDCEFEYQLAKAIDPLNGKVLEDNSGQKIVAFAGLAFPQHFFSQLKELYPRSEFTYVTLSDHFHYDADFINRMKNQYSHADCFITTDKDYAKLMHMENRDLYISSLKLVETEQSELIDSILKKISAVN